jgi:hypothetical protein
MVIPLSNEYKTAKKLLTRALTAERRAKERIVYGRILQRPKKASNSSAASRKGAVSENGQPGGETGTGIGPTNSQKNDS